MNLTMTTPPDEIAKLADALYWDKIRMARKATFEQQFLAGPQLFDYACRIMCAGIRMQNPGTTDEEVERMLRERLDLQRRLEKAR